MSLNGISTLSTRQLRLEGKLTLAQAKRQGKVVAGDGTITGSVNSTKLYYRAANVYDANLLPTKYSGNTLVDNFGNLMPYHPWIDVLPTQLFSASEQGVMFDISNLASLFQDVAGTIPVTTAGQAVALVKDKSGKGHDLTQATLANRPTWQVDPYGYGYLAFDGINDFMVTNNIDLTGTAKVTASIGLLVDPTKVTAGVAMCTGGDPSSVNGTFLIGAPSSTADHSFYLRGTTTIQARVPNQVAGDDILTGVFDISQASKELELIPRLSGVASTNIVWTGTTAGTGNFANLPLYVGALGGTSTFFKGHVYSIVVRGALSTSTEITNTETWINDRLD